MTPSRLPMLIVLAALTVVSSSAWADPEAEETERASDDADSESDVGALDPPTTDGSEAPLAVPAAPAPGAESTRPSVSESDRPLAIPGTRAPVQTTRPAPPGRAAAPPPPPDPEEQLWLIDAGYRTIWFGPSFAPTSGALGGRPHLVHATGSRLMKKNLMAGLSMEAPINPRGGYFPFVAEARVGWWQNAFGTALPRGPLLTLPGMKVTYIGIRWVHDHYVSAAGEWARAKDTGGLVLGYSYAAPFGELTVVTDTQFSLYLVNWGRSAFPLGLLNQRLSIGYDPVFIDARFRNDPATGTEISVGLSVQTLLGRKGSRQR